MSQADKRRRATSRRVSASAFGKRGINVKKAELRQTPLHERHLALGGKIVPFAGYELPVHYIGAIAEYLAVRKKAGLFDTSFKGKLLLSGPDATRNLQNLLTNDFSDMPVGGVRYSTMCNDAGGIVDDLVVYRHASDSYLLVVNATNREKDTSWIRSHLCGRVRFEDCSDGIAVLAIHGPTSERILGKLGDARQLPADRSAFEHDVKVAGICARISRSNNAGEAGFEMHVENRDAETLWDALLDAGTDYGLIPAGLGARGALHFEAGIPLYGHELADDITPLEAGLDFVVKMNKRDFIGKRALLEHGKPRRRRVGLRMAGQGIAYGHDEVFFGERAIGTTTSAAHCPYLGASFAMALLEVGFTPPGTQVEVAARGRRAAAEVVPMPFYKRRRGKRSSA